MQELPTHIDAARADLGEERDEGSREGSGLTRRTALKAGLITAGAVVGAGGTSFAAAAIQGAGSGGAGPQQVSALPSATIHKSGLAGNEPSASAFQYHYRLQKNGKQVYFGSKKPLSAAQLKSIEARIGTPAPGGPGSPGPSGQ